MKTIVAYSGIVRFRSIQIQLVIDNGVGYSTELRSYQVTMKNSQTMRIAHSHMSIREISPFESLSPDISPKGLLFPPEKKKKKNVSMSRDCREEAL